MALPAEKLEQRLTQPQHNLRLVPDIKWELIDGAIVMMSPGKPGHSRASRNIFRKIDHFLQGQGGLCEAFMENIFVRLTEDNRFIPDIAVICDKSAVTDDEVNGPPDLIVEVLSPSTAKNDRGHKMRIYGKTGVKEYWIVDPNNFSIEVYMNNDGKMELDGYYAILPKTDPKFYKEIGQEIPETSFNSLTFPELNIDLYEIFADVLPEGY
ncbi:MAG: Uma2 family endonuclease [Clostridiales bacterium]|jgi:Uma2 family endonuclease|nr:Uma2 family endonuclease [Clostridiales bacterium]